MARLHQNFLRGTLSAGISSSDTTLSSAAFASLPAISAPNYMPIVIDPTGSAEIVHVTAHTASSTTATVVRGWEGTTAVSHSTGVSWVQGALAQDLYDWTVGGEMDGELLVFDLVVTGLTGAVAGSRLVGGTASGPPVTGTFAKRDFVVDGDGALWVCSASGSPGTWVKVGQAGAVETLSIEYSAADQTGVTGVVDITGLTGMAPSSIGTRPQELMVKVGRLRQAAGSTPSPAALLFYEGATIVDSCSVPPPPLASTSNASATVTPPMLFCRRSAAQLTSSTYKVQLAISVGTWSILNTNVSSKVSFKEV